MKTITKRLKFHVKGIVVIAFLIFGFVSCEQQNLQADDVPGEKGNVLENQQRQNNGKIDICHHGENNDQWKVISVSANSWAAHSLHGDVRLDDQDGDGYVPINECGMGQMGDCDDLDATISPGALEIFGDGIDQDCDGTDSSSDCPCFTAADLDQVGRPNFRVAGYGVCLLQIQDGNGNITFNAAAGCGIEGLPGSDEAWLIDYLNGTVNWTPATKPECGGLTSGQIIACQQLICERANASDLFNGLLNCNDVFSLNHDRLSWSNLKANSEYIFQTVNDGGPIKVLAKKE